MVVMSLLLTVYFQHGDDAHLRCTNDKNCEYVGLAHATRAQTAEALVAEVSLRITERCAYTTGKVQGIERSVALQPVPLVIR
jgi:hypothetical protein